METQLNMDAQRVIRVACPSIGREERKNITTVLDANQLSGGPMVDEFERKFASACGRLYGVSCNSGTTALELALRAMNIGPGHKVAMPTMTMVACANAVLHVGATPIFVDSLPTTGNANWTKPPKADAYINVHLYGVPSETLDIPDHLTIEDCAESHFATHANGQPAGSRGAFAAFSFYANKIITTGEGGMVLTNMRGQRDRLIGLRAHAFTPGEHFHHSELAMGVRMSELQAAIGLGQFERAQWLLSKREEIAGFYRTGLDCWWLETMLRPPGSVWWVYPVLIRKGSGYTRDAVRDHLHRHGVETRSFFKPLHLQPHLSEFAEFRKFPVAEDLYNRGFYLPLHASMDAQDTWHVADTLESMPRG